jgi:uncharacterized protein (UPF0332 family)
MRSEEFIDVAEKWCSKHDCNEAESRSAISRSYYGCFVLVKDFIEQKGLALVADKDLGSHERLIKTFSENRIVKKEEMRFFWTLKSERREADYDMKKDVDRIQALQTITSARLLYNKLKDGIKSHE